MRVYPQQLQLCLATQHRSVQGSNNAAHSAVDIYKPPGVVSQLFCQQFSHMLDQLISAKHQFIIYDDFNCPGVCGHQLNVILEYLLQRSGTTRSLPSTSSSSMMTSTVLKSAATSLTSSWKTCRSDLTWCSTSMQHAATILWTYGWPR